MTVNAGVQCQRGREKKDGTCEFLSLSFSLGFYRTFIPSSFQKRMSAIDENDLMSCSLFSSAEPTPLSSLSAASSYSSLVNCDEPSEREKAEIVEVVYDNINKRSAHSTLLPRHLNKLCSILEQPIDIHGQGSFPTLNIVSKDFLIELRRAFDLHHISISDIRLNGGKRDALLPRFFFEWPLLN